jgi:hypothetical protein
MNPREFERECHDVGLLEVIAAAVFAVVGILALVFNFGMGLGHTLGGLLLFAPIILFCGLGNLRDARMLRRLGV